MSELNVVIHGRGGQGAVTFSQIVAVALNESGKFCQAFPSFGPERCGAPVQAFVRISDNPIKIRSQIYNPDIAVVLDSSLLNMVDVTEGMNKDGILIINSNVSKDKLNIKNKNNFKIYSVDASSVALKTFGKDIVNTAMIGAFAKITDIVKIDSVYNGISQKFSDKELIELNKKAIKEVYDKC